VFCEWLAHALPEMSEINFGQLLECSRFLKRDQKQSRHRAASADAPTRQDNWIKNRADAARNQRLIGNCPVFEVWHRQDHSYPAKIAFGEMRIRRPPRLNRRQFSLAVTGW